MELSARVVIGADPGGQRELVHRLELRVVDGVLRVGDVATASADAHVVVPRRPFDVVDLEVGRSADQAAGPVHCAQRAWCLLASTTALGVRRSRRLVDCRPLIRRSTARPAHIGSFTARDTCVLANHETTHLSELTLFGFTSTALSPTVVERATTAESGIRRCVPGAGWSSARSTHSSSDARGAAILQSLGWETCWRSRNASTIHGITTSTPLTRGSAATRGSTHRG